ncbi:hypothetical protein QN277_013633 [Acacia crassicarpa]|uniref:Uncharacterized protein n=1 Tax=Acacia crassicarpa TaxID=499986 RepID=A0AAE1N2T8_9FABA|nr:hypothetical protein QN277_013633 [Acacia crassicarpa]
MYVRKTGFMFSRFYVADTRCFLWFVSCCNWFFVLIFCPSILKVSFIIYQNVLQEFNMSSLENLQIKGLEYVQLGFLPRNVAKWVSPLWDSCFFRFSGYICPKEALAVALGENCKIVQLILYVSEGQRFVDIAKMMQFEHIVAFSSLIASIQRCYGLKRLQEVICRVRTSCALTLAAIG